MLPISYAMKMRVIKLTRYWPGGPESCVGSARTLACWFIQSAEPGRRTGQATRPRGVIPQEPGIDPWQNESTRSKCGLHRRGEGLTSTRRPCLARPTVLRATGADFGSDCARLLDTTPFGETIECTLIPCTKWWDGLQKNQMTSRFLELVSAGSLRT